MSSASSPTSPSDFYTELLNARSTRILRRLSVVQVVLGCIAIAAGIGVVCIPTVPYMFSRQPVNQLLATGIWDGVLFSIAGVLGYRAASESIHKKVKAALITNILGACGAIAMMWFAALDMGMNKFCSVQSQTTTTQTTPTHSTLHWWDESTTATTVTVPPRILDGTTIDYQLWRECFHPVVINALFTMNIVCGLTGLIQLPIAIICSEICRRTGVCPCRCCGARPAPYAVMGEVADMNIINTSQHQQHRHTHTDAQHQHIQQLQLQHPQQHPHTQQNQQQPLSTHQHELHQQQE